MNEAMLEKPLQMSGLLKQKKLPKAFLSNIDIKYILCDIINGFDHEERQAIYLYSLLDITLDEISQVTGISKKHVASAISLYFERLMSKIRFFQSFMSYNGNELLSISEVLLLETAS